MADNRSTPAVANQSAVATDDMFSDARVEMIRNQIAKDAPDHIFAAMLDIARRRNLDPLSKQISLIKFGGQFTIITTIDGYRAIAEQTGQYVGSDAPVFTYAGEQTKAGKKAPDTATVTVHKLINGNAYPFSATVYFEEYSTGINNWSTMPRTMLAKVAESHALRKAFPAVMSGMYEESEMDQAIEGTARVVGSRASIETQAPAPQQIAPESRETAMRRLHAVAAANGFTHDDLHNWAVDRGKPSLKDMSTAALVTMANKIENETESAIDYFASLHTSAEGSGVEPETEVSTEPEDPYEGEYQEVDSDTGEIIPAHIGRGAQASFIDMPNEPAHART